jgi:ABC-type bacteriocin/lantibiotic exporter with double-glycine peptidase domain
VSLERINKYLRGDEFDENSIQREKRKEKVYIKDASFSFIRGEQAFLKNISLKVEQKELVAIVGNVGSGKSALLNAMLGNIFKIEGEGKRKMLLFDNYVCLFPSEHEWQHRLCATTSVDKERHFAK